MTLRFIQNCYVFELETKHGSASVLIIIVKGEKCAKVIMWIKVENKVT